MASLDGFCLDQLDPRMRRVASDSHCNVIVELPSDGAVSQDKDLKVVEESEKILGNGSHIGIIVRESIDQEQFPQ